MFGLCGYMCHGKMYAVYVELPAVERRVVYLTLYCLSYVWAKVYNVGGGTHEQSRKEGDNWCELTAIS